MVAPLESTQLPQCSEPTMNVNAMTSEGIISLLLQGCKMKLLLLDTDSKTGHQRSTHFIPDPTSTVKETQNCLYLFFHWKHEEYVYTPSRSMRFFLHQTETPYNGDAWTEVVVRHKKTGNLRSYFVSEKSNVKVWDEPPSGGSNIILAWLIKDWAGLCSTNSWKNRKKGSFVCCSVLIQVMTFQSSCWKPDVELTKSA